MIMRLETYFVGQDVDPTNVECVRLAAVILGQAAGVEIEMGEPLSFPQDPHSVDGRGLIDFKKIFSSSIEGTFNSVANHSAELILALGHFSYMQENNLGMAFEGAGLATADSRIAAEDHDTGGPRVATSTIAHELGHALGVRPNRNKRGYAHLDNHCPDKSCIMYKSLSDPEHHQLSFCACCSDHLAKLAQQVNTVDGYMLDRMEHGVIPPIHPVETF